MNVQFILFLVLFSIVGSHQKEVKVTIFYESLCTDSQRFINEHLTPAIASIGSYIDLNYIPYGKARHTRNNENSYDFTCQHGPLECYGNKVQACAIAQSNTRKKAVDFIDCAMEAMYIDNYKGQLKLCSRQSGISWDAIDRCVNSKKGSQLLATYGDITKANNIVSFVPTVIVNGRRVVESTYDFSSFFKKVCDLFSNKPKECYKKQ